MKKLLIILLTLFIVENTFGQEKCACDIALTNLVNKIESDYPGFEEKTKDSILYKNFKFDLIAKARKTEKSSCSNLLEEYLSFFKDKHISLISTNTSNTEETSFIDIDLKKFKKEFSNPSNSSEGIWEMWPKENNEVFKIGIKKIDSDTYVGFIIETTSSIWKPKQILFKLNSNGNYIFRGTEVTDDNYLIDENNILILNKMSLTFVKDNALSKIKKADLENQIRELKGFYIKKITSQTLLLSLPDFNYGYVDIIAKIIEENRSLLENSKYLIIDIRGNGGGTESAYAPILPYIMTNSIRDLWVENLATPEFINLYEKYLESILLKKGKEEEIKQIKKELSLLKENKGKYVNTEGENIIIKRVDVSSKSPNQVIILVDNKVGSAAEDFLIASKQSKKVKIIGTSSAGVIDYGAVIKFNFGCPDYQLNMPSHRSLRLPDYPIDNIGIQPDIYLDKSVKDWVEYAVDYLEN